MCVVMSENLKLEKKTRIRGGSIARKLLCFVLAVVFCLSGIPMFSPVREARAAGDIAIDSTNFPDANFREYVSDNFDSDHNGKLSQAEQDAVTEINVESRIINGSLRGIERFSNLERLDCFGNQLSTLDVSHNPNLTELDCDKNKLSTLDVSNNTKLTKVNADNQILDPAEVRWDAAANQFVINMDQYMPRNKTGNISVTDKAGLTYDSGYDAKFTAPSIGSDKTVKYNYDLGGGRSMKNISFNVPKDIVASSSNSAAPNGF